MYKRQRYFQLGKISEQTKTIWFVFHGYGMLSQYFIKKFKNLENNQTVIISPEALSRFYIGKNYERVGASWMTKLDREQEISDNILFLDKLFVSLNFDKSVLGAFSIKLLKEFSKFLKFLILICGRLCKRRPRLSRERRTAFI